MRCRATGKVRHHSPRAAEAAMRRVGIASLEVYQCGSCRGWHLGNLRDRAHYRIDQLLREHAERMEHANPDDEDSGGPAPPRGADKA